MQDTQALRLARRDPAPVPAARAAGPDAAGAPEQRVRRACRCRWMPRGSPGVTDASGASIVARSARPLALRRLGQRAIARRRHGAQRAGRTARRRRCRPRPEPVSARSHAARELASGGLAKQLPLADPAIMSMRSSCRSPASAATSASSPSVEVETAPGASAVGGVRRLDHCRRMASPRRRRELASGLGKCMARAGRAGPPTGGRAQRGRSPATACSSRCTARAGRHASSATCSRCAGVHGAVLAIGINDLGVGAPESFPGRAGRAADRLHRRSWPRVHGHAD